ncbi:hypothetical protein CLOM_g9634 [Closterium sp. NIES-68]|nr:hypothetical protein CLOM_g9634 [Closterium sp. NIES-68]GJP57747.1 hypothetical protein CLOP_g17312 [Closterium sp. NIES-67]
MRLLTSGADVHDWDGILSNGFSESVSSSAVHPTARTESEHVEEAEIRAAADCGLCRLDPARALFVEVSLTAVKKRAKQGFSDDEISLATLRCQVMTVLAASGRLSINMFDKAFCSLIGKPIRLADYGLRRLKDLGDVLPDVVQLNSAWSRFEKSRHLPSAVRERISQQRTLQLVSSPQNLRSLGLIQSRMRHLAHEALATVVADRGVMTSYCKGSGREGWLHIVSLQEELERRAEQPLCSLLIRHGFWEAGKQKSQLVWRFAALLQEMPDVVQMRVDTTGQVRVWPVGGPRDRLVTDWALQNPTWDGVLFQAVQLCTVTLIVQAVQEPVHGPSADVTITQEEGHAAAKSQ